MSAESIVSSISSVSSADRGSALLKLAHDFKDLPKDDNRYVASKEDMKAAYDGLNDNERDTLQRVYQRIKTFAQAQRDSVQGQ